MNGLVDTLTRRGVRADVGAIRASATPIGKVKE
jgi:hypothetical protein